MNNLQAQHTRINLIRFNERGNPRRYTISLPTAISPFHSRMLESMTGTHTMSNPRRRRAQTQDALENMINSIPDIASLMEQSMQEDNNIVDTIPVYKAEGDVDDCSICQETIKAGDSFRRLPCSSTVNHCFHQKCIDPWLERNTTCPNCRSKLN